MQVRQFLTGWPEDRKDIGFKMHFEYVPTNILQADIQVRSK